MRKMVPQTGTNIYVHKGLARLPSISNCAACHELAGLMSIGPDLPALFRCAGPLMDRMLKGAKPANIALEQGTKLESDVITRAAKANKRDQVRIVCRIQLAMCGRNSSLASLPARNLRAKCEHDPFGSFERGPLCPPFTPAGVVRTCCFPRVTRSLRLRAAAPQVESSGPSPSPLSG